MRLPGPVAPALVGGDIVNRLTRVVGDVGDPVRHAGKLLGDARAPVEVGPVGLGLVIRGHGLVHGPITKVLAGTPAATACQDNGGDEGNEGKAPHTENATPEHMIAGSPQSIPGFREWIDLTCPIGASRCPTSRTNVGGRAGAKSAACYARSFGSSARMSAVPPARPGRGRGIGRGPSRVAGFSASASG